MSRHVFLLIVCMFVQAHTHDRIVRELTANITRAIDESANASISAVVQSVAHYEAYRTKYNDQLVSTSVQEIASRMSSFKSGLDKLQSSFENNIVLDCLTEEGRFDDLLDEMANEVRECARIGAMEATNVISDSLNEAQVFMTIPEVVYNDLQACGLSASCMEKITFDAIEQSVQVPGKVVTLAGRIQEIVARTMVSVDGCSLGAMRRVGKSAIDIFEDILFCINDRIDNDL